MLERERLRARFDQKMARLLDMLSAEKHWGDVLDWGERWIALGQTPEPAYRALMTAHGAMGDMSPVAKTFERGMQSLRNDLGVEPSEQTRALYETLKRGRETPKAIPTISNTVAKHSVSSNIPVPLTSFIGRENELKEIARLLSSSCLLTLAGPGGVGKTRLAIQTAQDSPRFKDGVFWVDLVGLADASLIPQEIASSLKVREVPDVQLIETIKNDLASKTLLLILDNCEHLIEIAARAAEQLLGVCPSLKILATSRERLNISNETVWNVPSLSDNTSRQLFIERAHGAKHDFTLTASTEPFIEQICERLDSIPLAIELAAARVTILSTEELARRLDDRFADFWQSHRVAATADAPRDH